MLFDGGSKHGCFSTNDGPLHQYFYFSTFYFSTFYFLRLHLRLLLRLFGGPKHSTKFFGKQSPTICVLPLSPHTYTGLLSVYVGSGCQLLGMASVTLIFALLGFLSPARRGGSIHVPVPSHPTQQCPYFFDPLPLILCLCALVWQKCFSRSNGE